MTSFPDIVYRVPGPHYAGNGKGFDYRGVADADELKAALADGWHRTMGEALGDNDAKGVLAEVSEAREAVSDISDDTREALEVKAKALGVSFNSRTSDKVLAERIAAAQ